MASETSSFLDFGGRWVFVSGASSGLGRAAAVELARHGARVVLSGRDAERLTQTAQLLGGAEHRILPLDLAQLDGIAAAVQQLRQSTGPLYGLCHAAGTVQTRPLQASTVEVVREQLGVNLLAGLELARVLCRRDVMTEEGGSVLFVSSAYGRVGMAGQTAYSAGKGALYSATRAMAVELARRRIRVNTLSPGLVMTQMTDHALGLLTEDQVQRIRDSHPLGAGTPEDVARAAVFLLAPASRWITGTDLAVDGGLTAH